MIASVGTVGAGKSSLIEMVAKHLDSQAFYESTDDNEVLPLFYADPEQYISLLQIYSLNKRSTSIKRAMRSDDSVLDRSTYEDSLFFHLNTGLGRATETEVCVYDELLENVMEELPYTAYKKHPDLLAHIRISFDTVLEWIGKHGCLYKQLSFDPSLHDYCKELNRWHDQWYEGYKESPKIQIGRNRYNFVEGSQTKEEVLKMIREKLAEICQVELVI